MESLVASLQADIERAETAFSKAYWDSQIDVTPATEQLRNELEVEVGRVKGDPAALAAVRKALAEPPADATLRRSLEVLRLSLTANQMPDELRERLVALASSVESDFAAFRATVDGQTFTDNEIEDLLRTSDDEATRRTAWEGSKQVGARVADRVRELARLRNESARALGYPDYYRMELDLQELPEQWLFDTLDGLEKLTREPFLSWKNDLDARLAERFGVKELAPWHYADPFFQSLPAEGGVDLDPVLLGASAVDLAASTFREWGFDISGVIERSDLWPRERKSQHAFCIDIDRSGDDVRIMCNIVPGERWIEVMLHESGHAAYDISIGSNIPYLLHRATNIFVTEAMAIMSGALARDPEWLTNAAGVDRSTVDSLREKVDRARSTQSLLFARWVLVMTHFERDLYADPEGDLDSLWWDYVGRFQFVAKPPNRAEPDWAAKVHIAAAPVYYHNYLLGEVLASQLRATLKDNFGGTVSSDVGPWLRERLFQPGALYRWDELITRATGKPLAPDAFAAEVAG